MGAAPTDFENRVGDALEEIFDANFDQLADIIIKLNEMGVVAADGESWTEDSFQAEMKRLGT